MIPPAYAVMRRDGGFHNWAYAYAIAMAAAIATGERHRVYRAPVGWGMGWRVGPAVIR